jgi:V8-like Glu-specific endopeptidase
VSNNPHNLVYGPGKKKDGRSHRANDPKERKDNELFEKQSQEYKFAMNDFETKTTLDTFGNLPKTKTVNFQQYTGYPKEKRKLLKKYYAID